MAPSTLKNGLVIAGTIALLTLFPSDALARGGGGHSSYSTGGSHRSVAPHSRSSEARFD